MTKEPGTEAGGRRDEGQTRRGRMIDEVRHTHETRVTEWESREKASTGSYQMQRIPMIHGARILLS